jgi:hypothetical protein
MPHIPNVIILSQITADKKKAIYFIREMVPVGHKVPAVVHHLQMADFFYPFTPLQRILLHDW